MSASMLPLALYTLPRQSRLVLYSQRLAVSLPAWPVPGPALQSPRCDRPEATAGLSGAHSGVTVKQGLGQTRRGVRLQAAGVQHQAGWAAWPGRPRQATWTDLQRCTGWAPPCAPSPALLPSPYRWRQQLARPFWGQAVCAAGHSAASTACRCELQPSPGGPPWADGPSSPPKRPPKARGVLRVGTAIGRFSHS